MAIYCRDVSLLFIMAPRTGCTATAHFLVEKFGGVYVPENDIVKDDGSFAVQSKHCGVKELLEYGILTKEFLSGVTVFTTVRNHFDSLYSLYEKKRGKYARLIEDKSSWIYRVPGYVEDIKYCMEHRFDQWLALRYPVSLKNRILRTGRRAMYKKFLYGADVVLRYESLQSDFDALMRRIGYREKAEIPLINKTDGKAISDYRRAYSPDSRSRIEYVFGPEMKKLGYKF